jgi:hypothetical protein
VNWIDGQRCIKKCKHGENKNIANFMGHDILIIIVVQNLFFIGLYGMDINENHLLVLFEH